MLGWSAAAAAQDGTGSNDQCPAAALPAIGQTDVATLERNDDGSAVIELEVAATSTDGSALTYTFSSPDGTIVGDGSHATWTVSGAGPFSADVRVSNAAGCTSAARFTYHMEQTASQ
jgi:hypothetical protein